MLSKAEKGVRDLTSERYRYSEDILCVEKESLPQERTMRQTADAELPRLRQQAPGTNGETAALSERTLAPMAFSLNHSNALCLPLLTDGKKLIWIHTNQINLQMNGAAEMDKAFDRSPYLTQKQMAALAKRCSLHPDQVKLWFMVQRLRYGISWDSKDIIKIHRKFKSSREKGVMQNHGGGKKKWRQKEKESNGNKAGEDSQKKSAKKERMAGGNVRASKRLQRKKKLAMKKKNRNVEELENDKRYPRKKQKIMTMADRMGRKRRVNDVERAGEAEISDHQMESTKYKSTNSEVNIFTGKKAKATADKSFPSVQEWPAHRSFVVPDEALDVHPPLIPLSETQASDVPPHTDNQTTDTHMTDTEAEEEGELHADVANSSSAITDLKLKELVEVSSNALIDKHSSFVDNRKTGRQLAMIKAAFLHCQYPDKEAYDGLANLTGLKRCQLIQWFSDMRYYIKKAKPRWMNVEQHRQIRANIKFQQWLNSLPKALLSEGSGIETQRMKSCTSCVKGENMQVPPEKK